MKKVRYAVGAAIGLAPALALAMPGAAQAATARPQLAGDGAARTAGAAKAVAGHPLRSAGDFADCTGTSEAGSYNPPDSQTMWFWYTHHGASTCIGTVDGNYNRRGENPNPSFFRVRIWYYDTIAASKFGTIFPTNYASIFSGTTAFHQYYKEPVRVCAAWLNAQEDVIGSPACVTV